MDPQPALSSPHQQRHANDPRHQPRMITYHINNVNNESDPLLTQWLPPPSVISTTSSSGSQPLRPSLSFHNPLFSINRGFLLTIAVAIIILTLLGMSSTAYHYPSHPNLNPALEWDTPIQCTPIEAWLPIMKGESTGNLDLVEDTVTELSLAYTGDVKGVIRIEASASTQDKLIRISTHYHSTSPYNHKSDLVEKKAAYYRRRFIGPAYPMDPRQCLIIASKITIPAGTKQVSELTLNVFSEFSNIEIDMKEAKYAFRNINVTLVNGDRFDLRNVGVTDTLLVSNIKAETILSNVSVSKLSMNQVAGASTLQNLEVLDTAEIQNESGNLVGDNLGGSFKLLNVHSHSGSVAITNLRFPNSPADVNLSASTGTCSASVQGLRGKFYADTLAGNSRMEINNRTEYAANINVRMARGRYVGGLEPLDQTLSMHSDASNFRIHLL